VVVDVGVEHLESISWNTCGRSLRTTQKGQ
jgi:hypothetical protein